MCGHWLADDDGPARGRYSSWRLRIVPGFMCMTTSGWRRPPIASTPDAWRPPDHELSNSTTVLDLGCIGRRSPQVPERLYGGPDIERARNPNRRPGRADATRSRPYTSATTSHRSVVVPHVESSRWDPPGGTAQIGYCLAGGEVDVGRGRPCGCPRRRIRSGNCPCVPPDRGQVHHDRGRRARNPGGPRVRSARRPVGGRPVRPVLPVAGPGCPGPGAGG